MYIYDFVMNLFSVFVKSELCSFHSYEIDSLTQEQATVLTNCVLLTYITAVKWVIPGLGNG